MAKTPKPSHVVELALETTASDERRLGGVFVAGSRLNNVLLQDGLLVVDAVRADPAWAAARKMPKKTREQRTARGDAFSSVRMARGFSDFSFQALASRHKNAAGFDDRLGANATQKLGTKVFKALEEYLLGKRGRPRFKGALRPLHSIEGKNNAADLRWDGDARFLVMNAAWGMPIKNLRLEKDEWLWTALQGKVKYCRVLWRMTGEKRRYYAQLVMDGKPPAKASVLARQLDVPKDARAGLDIGPSVLAWCTPDSAGLYRFCDEVEAPLRLARRLQRQVDRQRRANNPGNFNANGTVKRGVKLAPWKKSATQRAVEGKLRTAQAHAAECRINAHGRDINNLLSKARHVRHDGVSVRALQRNYGRSIAARAPGHFMSELHRKAESAGGSSEAVNVRQLKTSQYDHSTGAFVKKKLSERWHVFGDGRGRCQRDVYSAFLALHAVETVDDDGVVTWSHDPKLLEAAWVAIEPALLADGLFKRVDNTGATETQAKASTNSAKAAVCRRASVARRSASHLVQNSKAEKPDAARARNSKPGRRACRAVRFGKFSLATGLNLPDDVRKDDVGHAPR